MKKYFYLFFIFCIWLPIQGVAVDAVKPGEKVSTQPEFRAVWVTRTAWPDKDPQVCKDKITKIMEDLKKANFNVVVFQIRGETETLYPSTIEPWSYLFDHKDPGFDPVKFAIEQAHKNGLEFHAYINPMPLYPGGRQPPPKDLVPTPLWYLHGPDCPDSWVCRDKEGKIMDGKKEEYYYMSPGIPQVQEYLRNVIMDVVKRYDVDGIHLDRIRYAGSEYSHDSISEFRFYGRGNPGIKDFQDWERDQLDKFVNDLAAEIHAEKPKVVLSCAAWGIYNRYNIPGYWGFSSGYHDYLQDTWNWVKLGAMDYLMPMIYWNIPDPKPNYNELTDDFIKGVGKEHFIGGQRLFRNDSTENINEIQYTRNAGGAGTVIFSYGGRGSAFIDMLKENIYQEKVSVPERKWKTNPDSGIIIGKVLDESGKPVTDAWVALLGQGGSGRGGRRGGGEPVIQQWVSGSDGRFAFLKVAPGTARVRVQYSGLENSVTQEIKISAGEVKKADITLPGVQPIEAQPFIQILSPNNNTTTSSSTVHILGRTNPSNNIHINGTNIPIYWTGAFADDDIPVSMGNNHIQINLDSPDGKRVTQYVDVTRVDKEVTKPVEKTFQIVEPDQNVSLMTGDVLDIKVTGPEGYTGFVQLTPKLKLTLEEIDKGVYVAGYRLNMDMKLNNSSFVVQMKPEKGSTVKLESKTKITVWDDKIPVIGMSVTERTGVVLGLHTVRLGGPYLTELPMSTKFEIIGQNGTNYKVKLSKSQTGWVDVSNIKLLKPGTPVPHGYFTACSIDGDTTYDKLVIYAGDDVAYALISETEPSNKIYLDLYNTHWANTWISHKTGAKVIGMVTGEQMEEDWVRMTIPVKTKQIWGYWVEKTGNTLTLYVKRAPKIADAPDSPVKGLLFALEAGHGGNTNTGAGGLMGTKEKTVNYLGIQAVKKLLEQKGANTVEVRPGDSNPSLPDRVETANAAKADFFLSLHANSGGTNRGFLKVSGTSTYYKDKQGAVPAKLVYDQMLKLGWGEFGCVGDFHYYPLRNTRMPSILVEQAFMSNPYDEARLLDEKYQAEEAKAIVAGLEEFLNKVKE